MKTREVNFDGVVGPTHHYGGLSLGNTASGRHRWQESHPRKAALQGLEKMKLVADLGISQAVLPPHSRPSLSILHQAGFRGSDADIVERAWRESPELLSACYSASAMWTANAATVAPGVDTLDGKVHVVPANLISMLHRSIEAPFTTALLKHLFGGEGFAHHAPLPPVNPFADEGGANHTRFHRRGDDTGIHLFVYGFAPFDNGTGTRRFPPRQSLEASRAVARLNQLAPNRCFFLRQSSEAIDAGAFHNDVVAVGNEDLLFCHEQAFAGGRPVIDDLSATFERETGAPLFLCQVPESWLSLDEAIRTYLFNSQILTLPDGGMALIAPEECEKSSSVRSILRDLPSLTGGRIRQTRSVALRESMHNGGGPACLRLRVLLSDSEIETVNGRVFLDDPLYHELKASIGRHYRETLYPSDLSDPSLLEESRRALEDLYRILRLPAELL